MLQNVQLKFASMYALFMLEFSLNCTHKKHLFYNYREHKVAWKCSLLISRPDLEQLIVNLRQKQVDWASHLSFLICQFWTGALSSEARRRSMQLVVRQFWHCVAGALEKATNINLCVKAVSSHRAISVFPSLLNDFDI